MIGLSPCEARTIQGQAARGRPDTWNFLMGNATNATVDVDAASAICDYIAADSVVGAGAWGGCSVTGDGANVTAVQVVMPWLGLSRFREAMRAQGNPFGIGAIELEMATSPGKVCQPSRRPRAPHDEPPHDEPPMTNPA